MLMLPIGRRELLSYPPKPTWSLWVLLTSIVVAGILLWLVPSHISSNICLLCHQHVHVQQPTELWKHNNETRSRKTIKLEDFLTIVFHVLIQWNSKFVFFYKIEKKSFKRLAPLLCWIESAQGIRSCNLFFWKSQRKGSSVSVVSLLLSAFLQKGTTIYCGERIHRLLER